MKTISRYIMTLVALLALTTHAWATDVYVVGNGNGEDNWLNGVAWAPDAPANKMTEQNGVYSITFTNVGANSDLEFKFTINGSWNENFGCISTDENQLNKTNSNIEADGMNIMFVLTEPADVTISFNLSELTYMISTNGMKVGDDTPVEWNAATKTGTFAMPASDVVLTPIYAASAQWAIESDKELLPKAAEGVIAGTDAPLIEEGTVATGQGTVMYFATTDATMTAEQAAQANGWLSTVPTAEAYDDATTVYVWYYIQGADTPDGQEPTDKNTFNDSEICATPITVNVLTDKFDLTFKAANANTIDATQATVTVGGTAATVTEGKLKGVKMGSEVKMTAKDGYKFRKVEVKKTTDFTDRVSMTAWTGMQAMSPAFSTPEVTTSDGRKARFAEVYRTNVSETGVIMQQTVNVANGTYIVELYANSCAAQGVTTDMADGATDVAYVFANDVKKFITCKIASGFSESGVYTLEVTVTDGQLTLGIGKEKAGTNWHTIQIKSLNQKASSGNE